MRYGSEIQRKIAKKRRGKLENQKKIAEDFSILFAHFVYDKTMEGARGDGKKLDIFH